MKFSVDRESVSDIISALTSYSDDIDSEFRKFEYEIKNIAIKTNYNKLLYALQGIVDIYNDVICGSMRKQLIAQWVEEGESLHSFAEDVYMGEESEEAVMRIENSLDDIFLSPNNINLINIEFKGDSNASSEDFYDAMGCFESFEKNVEVIKKDYNKIFLENSEENELFRFLIPIIESVGVGVLSFLASSKDKMLSLGENYDEKMQVEKDRSKESKEMQKPIEFDLDLFDFDDDSYNGGTIPNITCHLENSTSEVKNNEDKSIEHIINIGMKMQQDFAAMRKDRKPIEQIIEYANADDLVDDILLFSTTECKFCRKITNSYRNELKQLENDYKKEFQYLNTKYNKLLTDCYKLIEKELNESRKTLERRYIKRIISAVMGNDIYQESITRANLLYNEKKSVLNQQYNLEYKNINDKYNMRCRSIEDREHESYSTGVISKCKSLYDNKNKYAQDIQNGDPCSREKLRNITSKIVKECDNPCEKFAKIYQDVYLSLKPSVLGFSCEALGHRITINEKRKTWIEANVKSSEAQGLSVDGILHMKTPVHEYLHYLSNGADGTSGVKNMAIINEIANDNCKQIMLQAMTGFNEGITEMFAQDYLKDEIATNNNFNNANEILKKEQNIVRKKSYTPQVDVIRSICKVLGNSNIVKEAYIKHDFSIVESEITIVLSQSGKSLDWIQARKDMAEIQCCYTDINPKTTRQSAMRARNLSEKIVGMLEA